MVAHYDITIVNEVTLINPEMSSTNTDHPASNVLIGELSSTTPWGETPVAGEWWKADIEDGACMVHSVHVVNRKDLGGERLARVQITVDGELCGSLPSVTETDVDYTVTCQTPVYGTEIRLTQINDTYLHFQGINVYCHPEYTVDLYE
jgi:hypothetical protein